ncbi:MAG: DUF3467 domain-containing protein [Phycisphaeraceae bacterium]
MAKNNPEPQGEVHNLDEQARQQAGNQQVRLRIDQRNMNVSYTNAFRTNATADEVIIDLGLNQVIPSNPGADGKPAEVSAEILFDINQRVILNYFTAKRLAITLGQIVRKHEERFGELKLNVADRAKK